MALSPALKHLKKVDPVLYAAALPFAKEFEAKLSHPRHGDEELFGALAGSVVGQQLSMKAADTIWERLKKAAGGEVTPERVKRMRVATMRKAGLSAAKAKTLKELAKAVLSGELDIPGLRTLPEEEAIAELSKIWGIGRWTSEMFLMFALTREDVFSPGDLALVRAMEELYSLPPGTKSAEFERIATAWSPHRTYACRVLWRLRDPQ